MRVAVVIALGMVVVACGGTRTVTRTHRVVSLCQPARFGYVVCGYPLQPSYQSEISLSNAHGVRRITGPAEVVKQHPSSPDGFWVADRIFRSPDGKTLLAQWSGECEAQSTYFVDVHSGKAVSVFDPSDESEALGWTGSRARVLAPRGLCGGTHGVPGIYLVDPKTRHATLIRRIKARPGSP